MKKENEFAEISEKFAIGYDNAQWTVHQGKRGKRRTVSFIGSTKRVLIDVLREKGCVPTTEGQAALDALPDTFREFIKTNNNRKSSKG